MSATDKDNAHLNKFKKESLSSDDFIVIRNTVSDKYDSVFSILGDRVISSFRGMSGCILVLDWDDERGK